MRESHLRSIIKSVSWRLFGTLSTMLITWMVTHQIQFALYVGLFEFFTKIGIFYIHERLWGAIRFGITHHASNISNKPEDHAMLSTTLSRVAFWLNKGLRLCRVPLLIARPSTIRQRAAEFEQHAATVLAYQAEIHQHQVALYRYEQYFGEMPVYDPANRTGSEFPSIVMVTLPKSGTIYTTALLSRGLNYAAYPRLNHVPHMNYFKVLATGGYISVNHLECCDTVLRPLNNYIKKWVLHVRDLRSTVLSFFHHLNYYAQQDSANIEYWFSSQDELHRYVALSPSDKLDWCIEHILPEYVLWLERWLTAVDSKRYSILLATFDELVDNETLFVHKILDFYNIPHDHFSAVDVARTMKDTHFRNGKKDEWCDVFSPQQLEECNRFIGPSILKRFGWDKLALRTQESGVPQAALVVE